ncbi:NADH-quinone oxidoreductase subunit L [Mucilaginibacter terrenus]|uniref:NADH-quinone oxidoreductase subunit L n=2 Tax=Mucilaginibacter terrenus TaxID=2482727 RepID=A0A3E2NYP1_9SPHI|nr:NADH-quinone oxidoreductase subunit L [Mucilaginibacter terrenus]
MAAVLPFAAFAVNFLVFTKSKVAGWASTLAILGSSVLAATVFARVWNTHTIHVQTVWFTIGATKVYAGILLNNLSVLLLGLVSVVALPVHVYGTTYMKDDENFSLYFRYLSFFCFSMLALVIVDSLVLFYAFWELVGFSSYLLIGFWYHRDKAVAANKKAFIMNRIGDIGLLSAIIILFVQFGTFDIDALFRSDGLVASSVLANGEWTSTINHLPAMWHYIAFAGIFLAVAAKSSQFPLHTWLPDAMEGPTSVSALIHAATMVASGVFLLGRVYPLFNAGELTFLAIIGCFTAFMAATIALTQNDLKRILAYSTVSQLGYMVMAMGVGAYSSSLFHLATHAFFKCLLFLVAGVIIHEVKHISDENNLDIDPQNILHMGGLRKRLPVTFWVAIVGAVALIGLPLTSGYLSKDGILIQAFNWSDGKSGIFKLVPAIATFTSWLTAFYVARLIVKVFFGEFRLLQMKPNISVHISDGGWGYKAPLILLALCCLFPLFSINPFSYEQAWPFTGLMQANAPAVEGAYHLVVPVLVNVVSLLVMYGAYRLYSGRSTWAFPQNNLLFRISCNEWYIDRFYNRVIVKYVVALSTAAFWFDRKVVDGFIHLLEKTGQLVAKAAAWTDKYIIDGTLWLLAQIVQAIGNFTRRFQGGKIQYYLYSMLLAVIVFFVFKLIWT